MIDANAELIHCYQKLPEKAIIRCPLPAYIQFPAVSPFCRPSLKMFRLLFLCRMHHRLRNKYHAVINEYYNCSSCRNRIPFFCFYYLDSVIPLLVFADGKVQFSSALIQVEIFLALQSLKKTLYASLILSLLHSSGCQRRKSSR